MDTVASQQGARTHANAILTKIVQIIVVLLGRGKTGDAQPVQLDTVGAIHIGKPALANLGF